MAFVILSEKDRTDGPGTVLCMLEVRRVCDQDRNKGIHTGSERVYI